MTLIVVVAICYFGIGVAQKYWNFYQYQDDMRQEARFASHFTNDAILVHLRASADSLGLPDDARQIAVRRSDHAITIDAEYDERIEVPGYKRDVHFHPHAEGTL
jgi:hypothetical protein